MKIKKLVAGDIVQGANKRGAARDLLTWIDEIFENHDVRVKMQRAIARNVGILSHGLIKWSDSVSKQQVADAFNMAVKQLKKEGVFDEPIK